MAEQVRIGVIGIGSGLRAAFDGAPMSPFFQDGHRPPEVIEVVLRSGENGWRRELPMA